MPGAVIVKPGYRRVLVEDEAAVTMIISVCKRMARKKFNEHSVPQENEPSAAVRADQPQTGVPARFFRRPDVAAVDQNSNEVR